MDQILLSKSLWEHSARTGGGGASITLAAEPEVSSCFLPIGTYRNSLTIRRWICKLSSFVSSGKEEPYLSPCLFPCHGTKADCIRLQWGCSKPELTWGECSAYAHSYAWVLPLNCTHCSLNRTGLGATANICKIQLTYSFSTASM